MNDDLAARFRALFARRQHPSFQPDHEHDQRGSWTVADTDGNVLAICHNELVAERIVELLIMHGMADIPDTIEGAA